MTPQVVAARIDQAMIDAAKEPSWAALDTLTRRRRLAAAMLRVLRRRGALEEPPTYTLETELPELPPHPDIPTAGEWIRKVLRKPSRHNWRDEPDGSWHLYRGTHTEQGGWTSLWSACGRALPINEMNCGWRWWADRRVGEPDGACGHCLKKSRLTDSERRRVERLLNEGADR